MATSRLYCNTDLQPGTKVQLDKTASHHLSIVLRAREGQTVCLFNGDGFDYFGVIESTAKNRSTCVSLTEAKPNQAESPIHTCLIQGISRNDRMDFTLQKATELGVNSVIAFRTDLVNQRVPFERIQKKASHWEAVIQSAAGQCGRARVPDFKLEDKLANAIAEASSDQLDVPSEIMGKWVLVPDGMRSLANSITANSAKLAAADSAKNSAARSEAPSTSRPRLASAMLIIGPERGLSEGEQELAVANGFEPVTLGPRVLRTETAPLAALSVIQTLAGDMR